MLGEKLKTKRSMGNIAVKNWLDVFAAKVPPLRFRKRIAKTIMAIIVRIEIFDINIAISLSNFSHEKQRTKHTAKDKANLVMIELFSLGTSRLTMVIKLINAMLIIDSRKRKHIAFAIFGP